MDADTADDVFASDASAAFAEARGRVRKLLRSRRSRKELDLSDLGALSELPPEISKIKTLASLDISGTKIADLSNLSGIKLTGVLNLDGSSVYNLHPLESQRELRLLYFSDTSVHDISVLSNLGSLKAIFLPDITFEEMYPLAGSTNISNGVSEGFVCMWPSGSGNDYFDALSKLSDPEETVLKINYLRQTLKFPLFWPENYKGREYFPSILELTELAEKDENLPSPLPGPHRFILGQGQIQATRVRDEPSQAEVAQQLIDQLKEDAIQLKAILDENYTDPILDSALGRLIQDLSYEASAIPLGRLQISLRRMQAFSAAYSDSGIERNVTLSGALSALADGIADLTTLYPALREIEAGRITLGILQSEDTDSVSDAIYAAINSIGNDSLVSSSVIRALSDGRVEIRSLGTMLENPGISLNGRAEALRRRCEIVGQQLLSVWNLSAAVVRWAGAEASAVTSESWRAAKAGIPEGARLGAKTATAGAVKLALMALAFKLAGPLGPIAVALPNFDSLVKALRKSASDERSDN